MITWTLIAWAAEEAPHAAQEAGGLSAIGLDWRALIFQVINFAILLTLLKLFAYKPIMSMLARRQQTIEEGLRTAAQAAHEKERLHADRQRVMKEAEQEAHQIVQQSKQQAVSIKETAETEAKNKTDKMVEQAKLRIEQEADNARAQLKGELKSLVAQATEKIIDVKLDADKDKELLDRALQEAQQAK